MCLTIANQGELKRFALSAFVFLSLAIALVPAAKADLEYYGIEDTIQDDLSVRNVITLQFNETISRLDYRVNFDISNLKAESNFDSADCEIKERNIISCDLQGIAPGKNQLTLSFDTVGGVKEVDGKFKFSANYGFLPTKKTFVLIRLPQYSILSEQVANSSFSPPNGKIISDGKSIAVFWEMDNVGQETLQFAVSYILPEGIPTYVIVSLTVVVIILMVAVMAYARRKRQPVEVITSVLNQDEKTIVDILKKSEGKALQKVLVREGNFSKAKVSRLVKDMKERGIVDIEPVSGRENRIILTMGKEKKEEKSPAEPPKTEGEQK